MKNSTARQLINATASALSGNGKAVWVVEYKYNTTDKLVYSQLMTYREAKAQARCIREAMGYASVIKVS